MKNEKQNGFSLESFVPSWPSLVMGTGIIPIALSLGSTKILFFKPLAAAFSLLSAVLLIVITVLWLIRLTRYRKKFIQELHHPVSGSFIPTMPISFMIIGINFTVIAPQYIGLQASLITAQVLFLAGAAGIYLLSWLIMPALFQNSNVQEIHGTFGWYIPPVSHLIVPVLGLELISKLNGGGLSDFYMTISLVSCGIGFFLFLFIGSNVFYRYLYKSSPVGKMAPTLFIGLAPTSILLIILVKLNAALKVLPDFGGSAELSGLIRIAGLSLWGFSLWWIVLSVIKIIGALKRKELGFVLSWWAFTFPAGAFAVATGALNHFMHRDWLGYFQIGVTIFLILIWVYVIVKTISGISDRTIFDE